MKFAIVMAVIAMSAIGVAGDVFLKKASEASRPFLSLSFMIGILIYSSTAFGWVIAMRHLKMATVGSVYSVATILLLVMAGMLFFDERPSLAEWVGIALAVASLAILARHA